MAAELARIGKRGAIVIPSSLRKRFSLHENDLLIAEDHGDGILLRPAIALPVENYTPERKAEFLLSNAIDAEDYENAKKEVQKMGLNPDTIPHFKKP